MAKRRRHSSAGKAVHMKKSRHRKRRGGKKSAIKA
jgi:hypothetical protein